MYNSPIFFLNFIKVRSLNISKILKFTNNSFNSVSHKNPYKKIGKEKFFYSIQQKLDIKYFIVD